VAPSQATTRSQALDPSNCLPFTGVLRPVRASCSRPWVCATARRWQSRACLPAPSVFAIRVAIAGACIESAVASHPPPSLSIPMSRRDRHRFAVGGTGQRLQCGCGLAVYLLAMEAHCRSVRMPQLRACAGHISEFLSSHTSGSLRISAPAVRIASLGQHRITRRPGHLCGRSRCHRARHFFVGCGYNTRVGQSRCQSTSTSRCLTGRRSRVGVLLIQCRQPRAQRDECL